jgi:acyl-CoA hydrolase/RimJ/RimL family protein N-acetyltransferase
MGNEIMADWKNKVVAPENVLAKLKPGLNIFLGTGMAEPRTLVKCLTQAKSKKIQDLELLQLGSFGDAVTETTKTGRCRLKTFFSGWVAEEAFRKGRMDLIPCRPSRIPALIESRQIPIDMAFIQVTPPDASGYCSLGGAVDVALLAMEQASLSVGEINPQIPQTYGDTFVHISEFDMLVESTEPLIYTPRPTVDDITDRMAANVASVVDDGSCIAFSEGSLFEALGRHLVHKRHLGIHSPFFTDAVMDLVKSGAVTNRRKANWRGRSVVSYAFGTPELMQWLDRNPLVEFQGIDKVFDSINIGKNNRFVAVSRASKVDLTSRVVLPYRGEGDMGRAVDFFNGAGLSPSGRRLIALSSRGNDGAPNICISVEGLPNQFGVRETVDMIVTEYGVANLYGRTVRERAQALIDIAHPDDRAALVEDAKKANIIYADQIFISDSAHLYPQHIQAKHTFKNDIEIRFRAIKPSDEEEMRRLFYRFSEKAVYSRYFTSILTMPHTKMQKYVNVDYSSFMSIVALAGDAGKGKIIAEARYAKLPARPYAEVAFIVDEAYQGLGIASYLLQMLVRVAKQRGLEGFIASVLGSNGAMMRVFERSGMNLETRSEEGIFSITMPFQ